MLTLLTWFSREICSPLTGGPSGGRTSEVRCHRALILSGACSSRSAIRIRIFKRMWDGGDMLSSNKGTMRSAVS